MHSSWSTERLIKRWADCFKDVENDIPTFPLLPLVVLVTRSCFCNRQPACNAVTCAAWWEEHVQLKCMSRVCIAVDDIPPACVCNAMGDILIACVCNAVGGIPILCHLCLRNDSICGVPLCVDQGRAPGRMPLHLQKALVLEAVSAFPHCHFDPSDRSCLEVPGTTKQ